MNFWILIFIFCFVFMPFSAVATHNKIRSSFKKYDEYRKIESVADEKVLIYKEVPQRPFEVVDVVRGHAVATLKNEKVYRILKRKAMQLGADAIIDVSCQRYGVGISCQGTGIRWQN